VRIDGTYGPAPRKAAEDRQAKAGRPEGASAGQVAGGAEVVSSHEPLIAAATATEEVNTAAVEEARALLQSGQLDTPEAAGRAAQAILDLGL
jgi:hypothetical protein